MILLIGLSLIASVFGSECLQDCPEPTLLYEDLGCKPVFGSPENCCPLQYDCSHIQERALKNDEICYFHGNAYAPGEKINNDEITANCLVECFCKKKASNRMGFTCAIYDCPMEEDRPSSGCHYKENLNECCSGPEVCPPFNTTCQVGEATYHEGQAFKAPHDNCVKCVCDKGFDGKYEAPFCKRRSCTQEVQYQPEIKNFCAPSYISKDDCCPLTWICPEKDFSLPEEMIAKDSDHHCKFGEHKLKIGASFKRTEGEKGKLACECSIPPYLTCIQNYDYPFYAPEY